LARQPELGVMLPLGWRGELTPLGDPPAQWGRLRELALTAEALDLDSVWVSDHLMTVPSVAGHDAVFECWTVTAALAQATTRVRLGQLASCPVFRSPALTAKIAATLDVISGGRLEWGVGAGWHEAEALAYGYEFPAAPARIALLEEHIDVVRALWTQPDVSHHGARFHLNDAQCDPKPVQRPHPPILVAGSGPRRTLRVVARLADRANWGGDPRTFSRTAAILRAHCDHIGRDLATIDLTWGGELFIRDHESDLRAQWRGAALQNDSFEAWRDRSLAGTPEQVAEKMHALVDVGCRAFIPWCHDSPADETLVRYATEVAPRVRRPGNA